MKLLLAALLSVLLVGCATGIHGERLGAWKTLQQWDDSLNSTEDRLGRKSY